MNACIERTIRVVAEGEAQSKPAKYWRTRSLAERLTETLKLHREGNELLRGGNPPFLYEIRLRDVDAGR